MFIACVENPGRMTTIRVFAAAVFALPVNPEGAMVMSNGEPPYVRFLGTPEGEGRVEALK